MQNRATKELFVVCLVSMRGLTAVTTPRRNHVQGSVYVSPRNSYCELSSNKRGPPKTGGLRPIINRPRLRNEQDASIRKTRSEAIQMKTIIHVNQHVIRSNIKTNSCEPVITVRTYKGVRRARTAKIKDENGKVVATLVYSPNKPLSCGARVWLETEMEVVCDD